MCIYEEHTRDHTLWALFFFKFSKHLEIQFLLSCNNSHFTFIHALATIIHILTNTVMAKIAPPVDPKSLPLTMSKRLTYQSGRKRLLLLMQMLPLPLLVWSGIPRRVSPLRLLRRRWRMHILTLMGMDIRKCINWYCYWYCTSCMIHGGWDWEFHWKKRV